MKRWYLSFVHKLETTKIDNKQNGLLDNYSKFPNFALLETKAKIKELVR